MKMPMPHKGHTVTMRKTVRLGAAPRWRLFRGLNRGTPHTLASRATHGIHTKQMINKKHLKNVRPIRHCEPPHAQVSLPVLSHAACASMSTTTTTTTTTRDRGDRYGPMEWAQLLGTCTHPPQIHSVITLVGLLGS